MPVTCKQQQSPSQVRVWIQPQPQISFFSSHQWSVSLPFLLSRWTSSTFESTEDRFRASMFERVPFLCSSILNARSILCEEYFKNSNICLFRHFSEVNDAHSKWWEGGWRNQDYPSLNWSLPYHNDEQQMTRLVRFLLAQTAIQGAAPCLTYVCRIPQIWTLLHSVSYAGHSPGEPGFLHPVWTSELSDVQVCHNRKTLFPLATLKQNGHHWHF